MNVSKKPMTIRLGAITSLSVCGGIAVLTPGASASARHVVTDEAALGRAGFRDRIVHRLEHQGAKQFGTGADGTVDLAREDRVVPELRATAGRDQLDLRLRRVDRASASDRHVIDVTGDQVQIRMRGQEVLANGFALVWGPVRRLLRDDLIFRVTLVERRAEAFGVELGSQSGR